MGKFHPLLIHQRLSLYDGFGHIEQPIVMTFCEIVMTNVDELVFLEERIRGKRPFFWYTAVMTILVWFQNLPQIARVHCVSLTAPVLAMSFRPKGEILIPN